MTVLSFSDVRELGFLIREKTPLHRTFQKHWRLSNLGPLIELSMLFRANGVDGATLRTLLSPTRTLDAFLECGRAGEGSFRDRHQRSVSLIMCEADESTDYERRRVGIAEPTERFWKRWDVFSAWLEECGCSCGLSKRISQGVVGIVQELHDNIFQHSYLANSGLLGFRCDGQRLEIVVADLGVGILGGFERLAAGSFSSHRTALAAVVYDHRSRFDAKEGHGAGLRQVFAQLATLFGDLRFRTGDVSLTISGNNFTIDRITEAEEPLIPGFLVSFEIRPRHAL